MGTEAAIGVMVVVSLLAAPVGGAEPVPREPSAGDPATYEHRERACERNAPRKVDSLALPFPTCAEQFRPCKVPAGSYALPSSRDRQHRFVWQFVPWQEGHADFLGRYAAAETEEARLDLMNWCLRQDLPACAGFVCRSVIHAHWNDFRNGAYRKALVPWRKLVRQWPSPVTVDLPVRGEWYVASDITGHHQWKHHSVFAFDLLIQRQGKRHRGGNPKDVTAYYAWEQPFHAVADGVVASVVDEHDDAPAGQSGGYENANSLMVDHGGGVYAHYAHLRKGTARVRAGERVRRGQELALVGNSGASGVPHLHFTLCDAAYFSIPGRYRYEERTSRGWVRRDGADLRQGLYVRGTSAEPERPADTGVLPW